MTYANITQIEDFINRIEFMRSDTNTSIDKLATDAETLDSIILSSVKAYKPVGIDWRKISIYNIANMTSTYNKQTILNYLQIMLATLKGILDNECNYPMICSLRKDIELGENLHEDQRNNYIITTVEKYSGTILFTSAIQDYIQRCVEGSWFEDDTTKPFCDAVVEKLKMNLNNFTDAKKDGSTLTKSSPTINITQTNQQSQTLTSNIEVRFEECMKELDDCESISENEISELKNQIAEIQEMLNNKKGKKKAIREKIATILKWTADKATDVMIAVLPVLLESLKTVQ